MPSEFKVFIVFRSQILCRLVFLLFTLLHTQRKSAHGILVQDHGYLYPRPQIKPFLTLPLPQRFSSFHAPQFSNHHFTPTPAYHYQFRQPAATAPQQPLLPPSPPPPQNTFIDNFLHADDALYYSEDGRLLKQYEVMERIIGDLQHPESFLGSSPLLLDSFLAKFASQTSSPNFFDLGGLKQSFIQPVTRNHGPVALGSGSLGYIQLPNGAAYLGSGSLGYISGQQANQAIADAKTRKGNNPPGPLHF